MRLWTKRRLHQLVIIVLGGLAVGLPYTLYDPVVNMPDGYDYLQLARNLAETGRFRTDLISPLSWSLVPDLTGHPDLWRAPVYPALIAGGFKLFGTGETVGLVVSGLGFLLFLFVSYRIMCRLADANAAFFATIFLLSFDMLTRTGVTVFSESIYLLLVVLGLLVVLRPDDSPYLFGVLSALAYLTRYNHWFLLAGLLYVALRRGDQPRRNYLMKFVGVFLLVLSPWLIRNIYYTGSPFYHHHMYLLAGHNPIHPNFDVFFQFNPANPLWFALTHPGVMLTKWIRNIIGLYQWVPRYFTGAWPVAVMAVWQLAQNREGRRDSVRPLLAVFGIGFVLQAVALSFVHVKARHFVPFLTVICFLAGMTISDLYRRRKTLAVLLAIGIIGLNGIVWLSTDPWPTDVTPGDYRALAKHVPANEPVLTNAPELTAWYGHRTALWYAPYNQALKHYPRFNYVLLSPEARRNYSPRVSPGGSYLNNEAFRRDFELVETFPTSGTRLFVRTLPHQSSR